MDFETAVKLIPLYGDSRNDDLQSYIDAVTFVIENCKTEDKNQYLKIAKIRLRGEVGAAVRRNELDSWNELKKFLRERGDKQQSDSYIEDQLIYGRQGAKESIREFADRIERLGHKLIIALARAGVESKSAELTAERRMHKSFSKGVNEPIKSILLNRKTESFNDAVKDALCLELEIEEDRDLERKRRPAPSSRPNDNRCFKCNKYGHKAVECRSKINQTTQVKQVMRSPNTCYNCGKGGHYARDCRLPPRNHNLRGSSQSNNTYQQSGNGRHLPMTSRPGGYQSQHKSGEYKATERVPSQ